MQTLWIIRVFNVFGVIVFLSVSTYCDDPSCFQVPSSKCSELKSGEKCKRVESDTSSAQIFCCNITSENEIKTYITKLTQNEQYQSSIKVKGFHLRNSNLSRLSQDVFFGLRGDLVSLSITESNIMQWSGTFTDHWIISCFNFSHNTFVSNISSQFIANLTSLRNFAISNNNITEIPDLPRIPTSGLFTLDVSGNPHLVCGGLLKLITDIQATNKSLTFVNRNNTTCAPPVIKDHKDLHVQLSDIEIDVKRTYENCPVFKKNKCECSIYRLDFTEDKDRNKTDRDFWYSSLINCSSLGLQSLPNFLPPNARILDISNNSITSFEGIGNQTFNSIRELNADNNKINTLNHLEGTDFFVLVQMLSVRNNNIDQIQEYLFSNIFHRDGYGVRLQLAQNYFKCDCNTASKVKLWLIVNQANVVDYDQIYANCENYPIRVVDLNPKDLCSKPHNWRDYIRYIIGLEVLMFVLLIGKVSYDYYVFKTAGYLPWPASKMPKLPCDWCFET